MHVELAHWQQEQIHGQIKYLISLIPGLLVFAESCLKKFAIYQKSLSSMNNSMRVSLQQSEEKS